MELDNNAHPVFFLHSHFVLAVKYRREVSDEAVSNRARQIFSYIAPNYNITLMEWNHGPGHVHIQFKAHPKTAISKFINACKSAITRHIKKDFPDIRSRLWKESFWSQSFCLVTAGGAPMSVMEDYIESQGEKPRTKHTNSGYVPMQGSPCC
ncbi:MAG: IS200/IS605 family transposase [Eubacteriaceae bacterium]|nr:IS200/IS605 family transposase [Eubacteriaceae bacterium]